MLNARDWGNSFFVLVYIDNYKFKTMENEKELLKKIKEYMTQVEQVCHPMREGVLDSLEILLEHQGQWTIEELREEFLEIKEECPF